jgi:ACS family hexuronate transporter-like MFS transporter
MAGSVGGVLFSVSAGKILQLTHSYVVLFAMSASAYLISIAVIHMLAPNLKKVDFTA